MQTILKQTPQSGPVLHGLRCLFLGIALVVVGCGPKGPSDILSGKVTLGDQTVSGSLTFIGPGKKEVTVPINPDGTYMVPGPERGENQIIVKGGPMLPTPNPKASADMPGAGTGAKMGGVAPPKKYENPDNGLKVTVTGGKQQHDITLTP